jgi:FkbM family methyltransferase
MKNQILHCMAFMAVFLCFLLVVGGAYIPFSYQNFYSEYSIEGSADEQDMVRIASVFAAVHGLEGQEDAVLRAMIEARKINSPMLGGNMELVLTRAVHRPENATRSDALSCMTTWYPRVAVLTSDSFLASVISITGEWEMEVQALLSHFLEPGDIAVDCGANYGIHTLAMARQVGSTGRVISFEPQPAIFSALHTNIALNDFPWVEPKNMGVGARSGFFDVPLRVQNSGAFSLRDAGFSRSGTTSEVKRRIPVVSLDEAMASYPCPSVLKIDVEGMELEVLKGAESILFSCSPVIFLEYHFVRSRDDALSERTPEILQILWDHGYSIHWACMLYAYESNFSRARELKGGSGISPNLLAVPSAYREEECASDDGGVEPRLSLEETFYQWTRVDPADPLTWFVQVNEDGDWSCPGVVCEQHR